MLKKEGERDNYINRNEECVFVRENPNRMQKTPHLEDNLIIIKDPKGRVCL